MLAALVAPTDGPRLLPSGTRLGNPSPHPVPPPSSSPRRQSSWGPDGVYLWTIDTHDGSDRPNAFDVEIRDVGPGLPLGCVSTDVETSGLGLRRSGRA